MTFRACSSPAPTLVKPQPTPAILSQESIHTMLSITHHTKKRPSTGPRTTHGPHNSYMVLANSRSSRRKWFWDFGRVDLVGEVFSFEKNFYQLPFTPPISGRPIWSFKWDQSRLQIFSDSNHSKIQRWRTRIEDHVLYTLMGITTRCGRPG
jgi:hypothetical protein